jgi:hypothetical protein
MQKNLLWNQVATDAFSLTREPSAPHWMAAFPKCSRAKARSTVVARARRKEARARPSSRSGQNNAVNYSRA